MALPSTSTGSNAWRPRRWSVGARFSSTGCSWMTSSRTSQTSGIIESTIFLAALILDGLALDEPRHDERLEELEGHQLGQAALVIFSSGPATMTERPE